MSGVKSVGTNNEARVAPYAATARTVAERWREAGLGELLAKMRSRVEDLDGVRGTVRLGPPLPQRSLDELAAVIGWAALQRAGRGGELRISLPELDRRLRNSRFAVTLVAVLEADGGPLIPRGQREREAAARWEDQLRVLVESVPAGSAAGRWATGLGGTSPSAKWYRRRYGQDPPEAVRVALAVAKALAALEDQPRAGELLALFAARVTGDPHTYDPSTPAGILLLKALAEVYGDSPAPLAPSQGRAWLLSQAGLGTDGVSSTVLVANLKGSDHPVIEAMTIHGGGWPVPLAEVRMLRLAASQAKAFVVENPQVFEYLEHQTRGLPAGLRPTLVCTGGFLSAAATTLLDNLRATGCRILYGGDFDRNGLVIAGWLLERYEVELWHMRPEDYQCAVAETSGELLTTSDREWLRHLRGPLAPTAAAMAERGLPAYQERLTKVLLGDFAQAAAEGPPGELRLA